MTFQIVNSIPDGFRLSRGSHMTREDGMCAMEAAAWMAGEKHGDSPQCVSPVLARYVTQLNDKWNDEERQLLLTVVPRLLGTRADHKVDAKRAFVLVDSSVREIVPMALSAHGWNDLATQLRDIAPIVDTASSRAAHVVCAEVRTEARKLADAYAYAASYAASAAAYAADAYAAYAASSASAAAYYAYAYAYAASADASADARKPIVLATLAALERAIAIREAD